ncbi:hypothetical protein RUM43_008403 [Polyplax serrata]|uniref:Lipase domain-containing protein n=1 Tax=Polyplax serrata TaxID=468196 RepID=A0AAN8SAD0_POLSC
MVVGDLSPASVGVVSMINITFWANGTHASLWATPEQEAQDEKNDVAILKAVFTSMEEYWLRRLTTGHRKKRADSVVCYGNLGCFEDTGPFSYIDTLPSSPEEISTKFQLYSENGRSDVPLMEVPYSNMTQLWMWASKAFNTSTLMKIIVHGFGSSCNHVWVYEMRSALMSVEDCHVICVDWEAGALIPNYVRAVANTRLVGKQLAMLIRGLTERGLTLDKVHLIGFSLGAHVAGFAGAEIKNISRITGLDPAGPLFESQDPKVRLDETDALFVDVIHSNGENLILGGLGSWQPMGHVDFYPNGGRMQKGCTNLFVGAVSDIIWSASDIEGRSLCNHRRAYKFFTDSVSPRCHFPSFPCESYEKFIDGKCFPCTTKQECGNMGYYADKSTARGSLYLITREEEPFCAHQYHVKVESSPSNVPVLSYGKIQITLIGENLINETFTLTKKDDDELGVGTTLSRIVVPHPALEPLAVEILYIAYSGWISSGLKKWSIDKVKLSDSYGKSMSHCKKDLVLESKFPVTMKLFPGDCNLPKEPVTTTTEEIDPFFVTESGRKVQNTTVATPSLVLSKATDKPGLIIDGFPAYVNNNDYYEVLGNDSESAETNKVVIDAIIPKLSIQSPEKNYTMKIVRKHEITEPILQPKSSGRNFKEEIDEPVLKPIEKVEIIQTQFSSSPRKSSVKPRGIDLGTFTRNQNKIDNNQTGTWTIPREMHPPPLGWQASWDTDRDPKTMDFFEEEGPPPIVMEETKESPPMTLQKKMVHDDKSTKSEPKSFQKFYASPGHSMAYYPKNYDGSVTVQLFPQYLVTILKQAEHYARSNIFGSLETSSRVKTSSNKSHKQAVNIRLNKTDGTPLDVKKTSDKRYIETLATPREIETSKSLLPRIYEYLEKGLESMKSLFGLFQRAESARSEEVNGTESVQNETPAATTTTTTTTTITTNRALEENHRNANVTGGQSAEKL